MSSSDSTMERHIQGLEFVIKYTFNDKSILWEALQAPGSGVRYAGAREIPDGNKRLALVGDAVLKFIMVTDKYALGSTRGMVL
jgi:ribonuclease-3